MLMFCSICFFIDIDYRYSFNLLSYWEANLADQSHYGKDLNNMDPWIRMKYEQKRWVLTQSVPDPDNVPIIKVQTICGCTLSYFYQTILSL